MTFNDLGLIEPILKSLQQEGYTTPTPIQAQAIPLLLEQRDLLGCAQTGTGKTAAFSIPVLQLMYNRQQAAPPAKAPRSIKALILTPTRELAIQIEESLQAYGRHTGLKHLVIFGGVSQHSQVLSLKQGIDILVATPGRLLDLIQQGYIHLRDVEFFVLDEADRMLDMGFVHDVRKVITKLPAKRQTLLFSATMPIEIQHLAKTILHNPAFVEVTPVSSTAETIGQKVFFVEKNNKRLLLLEVLKDSAMSSVLVFTRTKHGADRVVKDLQKANITAQAIHGNKSQNARQNALNGFKNGQIRVLVATDIAARGIDIDELGHVINYEIPNIPETYVHRIGRTGRAGASGLAMSFCEGEELPYLKDIQKLIGRQIPVAELHPITTQANALLKPAPGASPAGQRPPARPQAARNHLGNRRSSHNSQQGKQQRSSSFSNTRSY